MTIGKLAEEAARDICAALTELRPPDVLAGEPKEKAEKRLEEIVAERVSGHLERAYTAGKLDGLQEAETRK
jgi:hypothetical protein